MPKRSHEEEILEVGTKAADRYGGQYSAMVAKGKGAAAQEVARNTGDSNLLTWMQQEQEYRAIGLVLMPEEFPTLLYADSYTSEKMAKKGILQSQQANWVTSAPEDTRWLRPDEYFFTSHRGNGSLWRRMHCYQVNPNQEEGHFTLKHSKSRSVTSGPSDYLKLQSGGTYFDFNLADCDPTSGGSNLAKAWNSPTMVCGRSESTMNDARWVLLNCVPAPDDADKRSLFRFTYSDPTGVSKPCRIEVHAWRGGEPTPVGSVSFAPAGDASQDVEMIGDTAGITDFFTFKYIYTPTTTPDVGRDTNFDGANGFKIEGFWYCSGLTQTPVDSAYQNIMQLGRLTIIAASCRITCMAPPLAIQGESVACQTRDPYLWYSWYNSARSGSALDLMSSYRDRYLGKAANGGYGWHMPFRKTQFELTQCCELDYDKNIIKDVWWDIEDDSDVNVFCVRSQNNGTNNGQTGQGCDFWITCVTHFNWTTDNKWPDADLAPYSFVVWASALDNLRFVPKVMSNKYHMPTLLSYLINTGKSFAKKYVPAMLKHGGRAAASAFLGEDLTDRGIKALKDAYSIGDEIVSRLKGGGM